MNSPAWWFRLLNPVPAHHRHRPHRFIRFSNDIIILLKCNYPRPVSVILSYGSSVYMTPATKSATVQFFPPNTTARFPVVTDAKTWPTQSERKNVLDNAALGHLSRTKKVRGRRVSAEGEFQKGPLPPKNTTLPSSSLVSIRSERRVTYRHRVCASYVDDDFVYFRHGLEFPVVSVLAGVQPALSCEAASDELLAFSLQIVLLSGVLRLAFGAQMRQHFDFFLRTTQQHRQRFTGHRGYGRK